jgi:hypothetical protein
VQRGVVGDRDVVVAVEAQGLADAEKAGGPVGVAPSVLTDEPRRPWLPLPEMSWTTWPRPSYIGQQPDSGPSEVAAAAGSARGRAQRRRRRPMRTGIAWKEL